MKNISYLILASLLSQNILAVTPQLPPNLENMNEAERKQAGAFFLFYSLAAQGLIGGKSGVCINYQPGDNGAEDRITLGISSDSFKTGKNDMDQSTRNNLKNALGPLMSNISTYLNGACSGSIDDCKKNRSISVDGYADAQPYISGKNNLESSITKNEALAGRRAGVYLDIIKEAGFSDFGKMSYAGHASPIGEYLREGVTPSENYNPTKTSYKPSDYKVDCPERRVTIVNIGYNGAPVDVSGKAGVVSPTVLAASKNFVKLSNMASSLQTLKAMKDLSMTNFSMDDVENGGANTDKLIEQIMKNNGITDPATIASCKNYSTRVMIKDAFDRYSELGPSQKSDIQSQLGASYSEKNILSAVSGGGKSNKSMAILFSKTPTGLLQAGDYPLLARGGGNDGISTSPSDCFSAKNSLQMEVSSNSGLRSRICKSGKEFFPKDSKEVKVSYDPHLQGSLHIGCNACKTGMRYVPDPKKPGSFLPIYIDREIGSANASPKLNGYEPISAVEIESYKPHVSTVENYIKQYKSCVDSRQTEIDSQILKLKEVPSKQRDNNEINSLKAEKKALTDGENFFNKLSVAMELDSSSNALDKSYSLGVTGNQKSVVLSNFDDPNMKEFLPKIMTIPKGSCKAVKAVKKGDVSLSIDDLLAVNKMANHYYNAPLGVREKKYFKAKMSSNQDSDDKNVIDYFEKVLAPNIVARNHLSNWDGSNKNQSMENNFTFGGMKKPTFYVIPNCNCDDSNLVENAMKNGIAGVLDPVPNDKTISVNDAQSSCVFSPPVPSSCMYDPNEAGASGSDQKKEDPKIQWMGLDGKLVEAYLADLSQFMSSTNNKFQLADCADLRPEEVAQKIVESSMCGSTIKIPQGDPIDCKK